ncbi:MAG: 6-phosphogluconolactonase [Myxococcaceae bacterium]
MAQYSLINFDSETEFVDHVVSEFKSLAQDAIAKRGRFNVALSGGNTPKIFFQALLKNEFDWSKIHLYWSDERYVSHSDPSSNFGVVHRILLSHILIPLANIHGIPVESPDPHEAAKKYEELLSQTQMDLVYLGIGSDGHTASLFPGVSFPTNTKVSAFFVRKLGDYRISMMADYINEAREVRFLVSGQDKKPVLDYITQTPEPPVRYPCQLIRSCTILAHGV